MKHQCEKRYNKGLLEHICTPWQSYKTLLRHFDKVKRNIWWCVFANFAQNLKSSKQSHHQILYENSIVTKRKIKFIILNLKHCKLRNKLFIYIVLHKRSIMWCLLKRAKTFLIWMRAINSWMPRKCYYAWILYECDIWVCHVSAFYTQMLKSDSA